VVRGYVTLNMNRTNFQYLAIVTFLIITMVIKQQIGGSCYLKKVTMLRKAPKVYQNCQ